MTDISVTDHALVRYLERVHGVDMDAFRDALRSEISGAAVAVGAAVGGFYAVKRGGYTYICCGRRVITVMARTGATIGLLEGAQP